MQKQSKGRKALEKRMGKAVDKFAKQEGPKVLKQIQGETPPKTPKGQLSFPGMGKSFGRGAERRASAAQDAAIDIAKQQRKEAGFKDLGNHKNNMVFQNQNRKLDQVPKRYLQQKK
jgi:hypothetical protein